MNNLTINLRDVSDEDKKILMEIVERSNAPKNKVWKPVEDETVYALWANGEITVQKYYHDYMHFGYEQGHIFPTKVETERSIHREEGDI